MNGSRAWTGVSLLLLAINVIGLAYHVFGEHKPLPHESWTMALQLCAIAMLGLIGNIGKQAYAEEHALKLRGILLDHLAGKLTLAQTLSRSTLDTLYARTAHVDRRIAVWDVIRTAAEINTTAEEMQKIIEPVNPIILRDAVNRLVERGGTPWPKGSEPWKQLLIDASQRRGYWSAHENDLFVNSMPPF